MPIIIQEPESGGGFGPGFTVDIRTDIVGPVQLPRWLIENFPSGGSEAVREHTFVPTDPHNFEGVVFMGDQAVTRPTAPWRDGQPATLRITLLSNNQLVEETTIPVVNQETVGRVFQLSQQVTGNGGALSPIQAQQLEETHASTFPAISMDDLTLQEISSGPQGGVVSAQLGAWIMGVIVRIATVPPEFRVDTADGLYWVRSLAVVRIYRGTDLWKRVPVHTESKLITFVDEGLVTAVATIFPVQWLLQISIQVSFAQGVTGQVFLMQTP